MTWGVKPNTNKIKNGWLLSIVLKFRMSEEKIFLNKPHFVLIQVASRLGSIFHDNLNVQENQSIQNV